MRAAAVADQGMDLVHDDGAHSGEDFAPGGRSQQQIKRLGSGDQNVGRMPRDGLALGRGRITRAHRRAHRNVPAFSGLQLGPQLGERFFQVFVDVIA